MLTWRAEHHVPLGISTTYLYVQPRNQAALAAQPFIQYLVAANQLRLVSWGDFSFYKDWDVYVEYSGCARRAFFLGHQHTRVGGGFGRICHHR